MLDERRDSAGDARVSVQTMVALVPTEAERAAVTETVARRFGSSGLGESRSSSARPTSWRRTSASQRARGVERHYVWFADFAPPETLHRFAEVIAAVGEPARPA